MPEAVKFNEEELKKVQNIQKSYVNIQQSFGQLTLAKLRLDEQEVGLKNSLNQLQNDETKFLDEITKKYGEGSLNPETGEFTPTAPVKSENKSE